MDAGNLQAPTMAQDLAALFRAGLVLYQQGRLNDAQAIMTRITQQQPRHFDALHLLGVIAARSHQAEQAVTLLRQAIAVDSSIAAAHRHLGNALRDLRRWDEALASYDRAITLRPEFAEAFVNRGMVLCELARPQEALASCRGAIALQPGNALAHSAIAALLVELQRPEEALLSSEHAIALAPQAAVSYCTRAAALKELGRFEEALACCDRAIELQPDLVVAYVNRGAVLRELQRQQEALASYRRALELQPNAAEVYANRAAVLQDLERPDEALASCDVAIKLRPDLALAHCNRGGALHDLMRLEEALGSYARAIALQPGLARAYVNSAFVHLQTGRYQQGWKLLERRRKPGAPAGTPEWPQPVWRGEENLAGSTLFIYWEQGLGDTIQFCRYARLAEQRGARVVLSVQDRLRVLIQGLSPTIDVIAATQKPAAFDLHCPMLGLPLAFRTTLENVPAAVPYLHAQPERVARWRQRLGGEGFKIGVCWQGNSHRSIDAGRSFPLRSLQPLATIPGVRLISLQKGAACQQLSEPLPHGMAVETLDEELDCGPDAFLDTAAVMQNLDLIITSDTSIAHLAGALARPAWVALRWVPDWRWMLERDDCPWYPTLRLFRQTSAGDWPGLFNTMYNELLQFAAILTGSQSDRQPVAMLADKR